MRNSKALKTDIATYGAILVSFLNEKLPSEIKVILFQNFQNDILQLSNVLKILKKRGGYKVKILLNWSFFWTWTQKT